eukprot:11801487-Alexandrium_andersonii.AAC.1
MEIGGEAQQPTWVSREPQEAIQNELKRCTQGCPPPGAPPESHTRDCPRDRRRGWPEPTKGRVGDVYMSATTGRPKLCRALVSPRACPIPSHHLHFQ